MMVSLCSTTLPICLFSLLFLATFLQSFFTYALIVPSPVLNRAIKVVDAEEKNGISISTRRKTSSENERHSFRSLTRVKSHSTDTLNSNEDFRYRNLVGRDNIKHPKLSSRQASLESDKKMVIQRIIIHMKAPGKDQSVLTTGPEFTQKAIQFAKENHKAFVYDAWDETFLKSGDLGPLTRPELASILLAAFAIYSTGEVYVIGSPGSQDDQDRESYIVWHTILPALQKSETATALVIINPKDFSDRRTIVWTHEKPSGRSHRHLTNVVSEAMDLANNLLENSPDIESGSDNAMAALPLNGPNDGNPDVADVESETG